LAGGPVSAVTVAILTHERREEAIRTVERALDLPEAPDVVVVDNASRDGTTAALRARFPRVRTICLERNLGAAGRNFALAAASTPYVALCDDDCAWLPGSLRNAARMLDRHAEMAVVSGGVTVGATGELDLTCRFMATSDIARHGPDLPGHGVIGFLAGASVVRRSAVLECGGFEPRLFLGCEEKLLAVDLAARGWSLRYVPEVRAQHDPSPRRTTALRALIGLRNELLFHWLRRRRDRAMRATAEAARRASREGIGLRAVWWTLAALPWAIPASRRLPASVERCLDAVE
jgi:GT2 family glycosyltransferase